MLTEADFEIAPCLKDGPLSTAGRSLVEAARALGRTRIASIKRAWTVPYLYDGMERILASQQEPTKQVVTLFERLGEDLHAESGARWEELAEYEHKRLADPLGDGVEERTGEHFSGLFDEFSTESFWQHPLNQLRVRLERNGVSPAIFEGKEILDAGCGSGRLSMVMSKLGAKHVTGIDISPRNVSVARRRAEAIGLDNVDVQEGSVLAFPFEDESFDLVVSYGVLHATVDWRKGVSEMMRVLRPGGVGLVLYLNEKPGGLFWDILEVTRAIVLPEDPELMRRAIELLGIAPERIIQILDPAMVPINVRLTTHDYEDCFREHGARDLRRFTRGADTDRIEKLYQEQPYAKEKFGIGDNRYIFSK